VAYALENAANNMAVQIKQVRRFIGPLSMFLTKSF
jgi:hypothetical protein